MTSINTLHFFCSGLLVVLLLKLFSHYPILNPLVKNNDGKWHCKKYNRISRDGGTVLFLFLLSICNPISNWYLFIILFIIFFVGLSDDIYPLSIPPRLALYLLASFIAIFMFDLTSFTVTSIIVPVIVCICLPVFTINAFNIIDNMDGVCILSFSICSIFLLFGFDIVIFPVVGNILLYTVILFAPIFFAFNVNGKTMLGNTGSTLLGFLVGLFCVAAFIQTGNWMKILTCIAYPTFDFLFVVCRRILEGREPWIGGTDHTSHFLALRYGEKWALFYIGLFQLSIGLLGFNYL